MVLAIVGDDLGKWMTIESIQQSRLWHAFLTLEIAVVSLFEIRVPSQYYWRNGMNASDVKAGEQVKDVRFTEDTIAVDLLDGRTIIVPLAWYPILLEATPEQRTKWQISGAGYGIYWPDIDEDLSTEGAVVWGVSGD